MTQEVRRIEVREQAERLLQGSLRHVRTAALAAALVPVAAVAVVSTETGESCPTSAGICGIVFYDANNNGIQDVGETGIEGAVVTVNGTSTATNPDGVWVFDLPPGTYEVSVQIPPGMQPSPANQGTDDTADSDGVPDGLGNSVATVTLPEGAPPDSSTDFGFTQTPVVQPGTGTPGYWMNHPEAWPVDSIAVGGVTYTKAQALQFLAATGKDKTFTMFSSLVSAKLNVLVGNDPSCVASTIDQADQWMAVYPAGSGVAASSLAWKLGEPLHRQMDNYNNGMLCAPHRD